MFDLIVGTPSAWTSARLRSPDELASAYEAGGGVPLAAWDFHLALAYFKIGVIAAGIDHRRRAGAAAGSGFDTAGESVAGYLELSLARL
jgi:aminoglycoside phosphotransferase (APT) family kinase protein